MAIVKLVISFLLSIGQVLSPVGAWIMAGGEDAFFTEWSAEDEFTADDYIELKKTPGNDFKILNLADVQLSDDEVYGEVGECAHAIVKKLIEEHKPDLITLSGDNAWGTMAYLELIELVDSYDIPWAPVMGNHDGQGCISEFWAAYHLSQAENCLFEFGPKDMGYGNYIINITENGNIVHTLFMMDTHSDADYTLDDGTTVSAYDHLWDNQQEWYKWAVKGIEKLAGHPVESTIIMHIPVIEYYNAWEVYMGDKENYGQIPEKYAPIAYGGKYELGGTPHYTAADGSIATINNGFFSLCKELGSTKNILVGHDHVNDFSILYEGIRLTYVVKTGPGCYYTASMIGGTTINIDTLGSASITQNYYDLADFGFTAEE